VLPGPRACTPHSLSTLFLARAVTHRSFFAACAGLLAGLVAQPALAQAPSSPLPTGKYVTSFDGSRLYYEACGHGSPVLLLHGFTGTSADWTTSPLLQALRAAGHQVVALDLRGNGRSAHPTALAGYAHNAEARDVLALATALGWAHYQLVGYSRGSIIAARVLVLDPRVSAAVLGGMGDAFTDPHWPRREAFARALSGSGERPDPALAGFLRSVQERGLDRQTLAWQQQAQPSTSPAALATIRVPVLVISGEADHDNGSAEVLARLLPRATVQRVPGVHGTAAQTPEFARAVTAFLQQPRRAARPGKR
jgi:pimeloyl-ACP methyl ester carboxylesterase